jgi:hypothetical protein
MLGEQEQQTLRFLTPKRRRKDPERDGEEPERDGEDPGHGGEDPVTAARTQVTAARSGSAARALRMTPSAFVRRFCPCWPGRRLASNGPVTPAPDHAVSQFEED